MKSLSFLVPATLSFLLTSCGYLAGDEKQQLEQAWLAKDQQLQQAVEQIRTQGLEAVASGAEAGTVASCVATTLVADPVGRLISVEGALVESAKVSQLLADLQQAFNAVAEASQRAVTAGHVGNAVKPDHAQQQQFRLNPALSAFW